MPKIQETPSRYLILCSFENIYKQKINDTLNCSTSLMEKINQEILKRFYKPIYIPILAIICSFLIILPKNSSRYKSTTKLTFLFGFCLLVFSETTLRYSTSTTISTFAYLLAPLIIFIFSYTMFYLKAKNV